MELTDKQLAKEQAAMALGHNLRIIALDAFVTVGEDLDWKAFEQIGAMISYERTPADRVIERLRGADAVLTNKVVIDATVIRALPDLKYIGVLATGYNNVDIAAAREAGVTVSNVPAYSTYSVAQTVIAHMLHIVNHVGDYARSVELGYWTACPDFTYRLHPIVEVAGHTMGIYGLGNIGSEVARIANAMGMKVIALTSKRGKDLPDYVEAVDKETLLRRADVLSLNAPLTPDNRGFINSATLAMMKPTAILINTARGGLVNEPDLAKALNGGKIYAAGLDVLSQEPPAADNPLLTARNCFITPHIGWEGEMARRNLVDTAAANLKAYMDGRPSNVINGR